MGEGSKESRVPIMVAVIGAVATVSVGVLANWDKLFGSAGRAPSAPSGVATAASPSAQPQTGQPQSPAAHAEPVAAFPAGSVAGAWIDDDGFTYSFRVEGNRVSYVQLRDGKPAGSGDGTISGRVLSYRYVDTLNDDSGACSGTLAADGLTIAGQCKDGKWTFKIVRSEEWRKNRHRAL